MRLVEVGLLQELAGQAGHLVDPRPQEVEGVAEREGEPVVLPLTP